MGLLQKLEQQRRRRKLHKGAVKTVKKFERSEAGKAKKLTAATERVARHHWGQKHWLALAEVAAYLGSVREAEARPFESELRAGKVSWWESDAGDARMGEISDELRAISKERSEAEEYALWSAPYAGDMEQKYSKAR